MIASSLTPTLIASPGNSACSCCSSALIEGSTTTSYCFRLSAPHTIRLTVPDFLPSTRISRGCTTTASAMSGLVTAMRVISKFVGTTVDRPAVTTTRSYFGCAVTAAVWAFGAPADAGCCAKAGTLDFVAVNATRKAATWRDPREKNVNDVFIERSPQFSWPHEWLPRCRSLSPALRQVQVERASQEPRRAGRAVLVAAAPRRSGRVARRCALRWL